MRYIDIHTHVNLNQFNEDFDDVMRGAENLDIATIQIGTDIETSKRAIELSESYTQTYATVGIHPSEDVDIQKSVSELQELAAHEKVIGVGETGLEYFHVKENIIRESQKELLMAHIMVANNTKKPLMLHVRNGAGGENAYRDVYSLINDNAQVYGNVHFFAGTKEDAASFFDIGYTISFTGVITFTDAYDDIIRFAPLDMLHAETDAPFVAPIPFRGKRNEPTYIPYVYKRIAEIKNIDEELVRTQLIENAQRLFGIK